MKNTQLCKSFKINIIKRYYPGRIIEHTSKILQLTSSNPFLISSNMFKYYKKYNSLFLTKIKSYETNSTIYYVTKQGIIGTNLQELSYNGSQTELSNNLKTFLDNSIEAKKVLAYVTVILDEPLKKIYTENIVLKAYEVTDKIGRAHV